MTKLIINILRILLYSICFYVILLPLKLWIISISISLILGFFAALLNEILLNIKNLKTNGKKINVRTVHSKRKRNT